MRLIEDEWNFNFKQKTLLGLVIVDLERPEEEQMVGIVKTLFASPSFVADSFKNPMPWVNQRIQHPCSDGKSPLLKSFNEILEHNANGGLHGLVTRWTISPACLSPRKPDEVDERGVVRDMMHQSFKILWRGFKIASLSLETVGETANIEAQAAQLRLLTEYPEHYPKPWQPGEDLRPRLFFLSRESYVKDDFWLVNGAFAHQPPRYGLCLTQNEIELVRWALLGLSNDELCEVLRITPAAVKERWKNVYRKVEAKGALSLGASASKGGRGPEKREPLLQFFRTLPEEIYGI